MTDLSGRRTSPPGGSTLSGGARRCNGPTARPTEARRHRLIVMPTAHESRIWGYGGGGRSPRGAAMELGLSPHTVRSALKVVFDKLGVGRQSELARVVMRLETALATQSASTLPAPLGE